MNMDMPLVRDWIAELRKVLHIRSCQHGFYQDLFGIEFKLGERFAARSDTKRFCALYAPMFEAER